MIYSDIYTRKIPTNYINLADKKNRNFFNSLNNNLELKEFYNKKLISYERYKERNTRIYNEICNKGELNNIEISNCRNKIIDNYNDEKLAKSLRLLIEKQKMKEEISRQRSLKLIIAWSLSPNTRKAQAEIISPKMKELLIKYKEISQINRLVLLRQLSQQEAQEMTDEINLTKEEEIAVLSFYKRSWELSGTEEWRADLQKSKEYIELYNSSGIEAIEEGNVKKAIIEWEERQKSKEIPA